MFLWQRFNYKLIVLRNDEDFIAVRNAFMSLRPSIVAWDTETTGLHIKTAKPFLVGFGFADRLYVYEPSHWRNDYIYKLVSEPFVKYFVAHNAKFDYHMMANFGSPLSDKIPLACSVSLARLTDYVDSGEPLSLASLGAFHVHEEAKFAVTAIKEHIKELNRVRYDKIKKYVKEHPEFKMTYMKFKELYLNRIQYVKTELDEHFDILDKLAPEPNYYDAYKERPNIMINYLADDVLLVLEIVSKLLPILDVVDKNRRTWHRENELIRTVAEMERVGMRVDIPYILESRQRLDEYISQKYKELWERADIKNLNTTESLLFKNPEFKVGQHQVIKTFFAVKYRIGMIASDEDALLEIVNNNYADGAREIANLIIELRTLTKWQNTYIEGMLNRLVGDRLYTDINNSGTVTGRVSSDFQQQPRNALISTEGVELFHPRKPFISDDDYQNYYIDFSNMELRVQAYYTMLTSSGDDNLCGAFMPFKHTNIITGEVYDPIKDLSHWDDGSWVNDSGEPWKPIDVHTATTIKAFPDIPITSPEFKSHYRDLGKRANFLKNYGGGKQALMDSLKISDEVATKLNGAYYKAFPKILDYQNWVETEIRSKGYVENLLGRRYYFQSTNEAYKGYNYLIQGSCADYLKLKQIEIGNFLKDKQSKMIMPIHDELVFSIKNGEEPLLKEIKNILEDAKVLMVSLPMVAEISTTTTNWAEKVGI